MIENKNLNINQEPKKIINVFLSIKNVKIAYIDFFKRFWIYFYLFKIEL